MSGPFAQAKAVLRAQRELVDHVTATLGALQDVADNIAAQVDHVYQGAWIPDEIEAGHQTFVGALYQAKLTAHAYARVLSEHEGRMGQ